MVPALRQRLRQWKERQPLVPFTVAALSGIGLDRWIEPGGFCWTIGGLAAGLFILVALIQHRSPQRDTGIVIAVMLLLMCLYAIRHHAQTSQYRQATVLSVVQSDPEPTILVGVIDASPHIEHPSAERWDQPRDPIDAPELVRDPWVTRLVVAIETIRRGTLDQASDGRVQVIVQSDVSDLRPGDRVRLFGQIRSYDAPNNPGVSDRRRWARSNDLHAWMTVQSANDIERLAPKASFGLILRVHRWITLLSSNARQTLISAVGPEESGLAVALVLGQRDLVDSPTNELLMTTGTAHLLSVSGLHLGIVVALVRFIAVLMNLSINRQAVLIGLVMLLYIAITGGRPPVLRAAVLVATWLISLIITRPNSPLNALCLAALLIALWSPSEVFAVGTQLSFLAVGTLLTCSHRLRPGRTAAAEARQMEERFDDLFEKTKPNWLRWLQWTLGGVLQGLWYSGCVTLTTLPLIWQHFHLVSPISVLINVLLTPLMTIALSAGLTSVVLGWTVGWLYESLAILPGTICRLMLALMQEMLEFASVIPMGHHWLPAPPQSCIAVFYIGLLLCLTLRPSGWRAATIVSCSVIWFIVSYWIATTPVPLPSNSLEATFVDVGHGTSVIVRSDESDVWLYDCGWLGNIENSSWSIESVLWSMGVTRLRCVVLSHADSDHYNAFPGLAKRFKIDCVVTPPGMLAEEGESLQPTKDAIDRYNIPVIEVHRDQSIPLSLSQLWGQEAVVRHPPAERVNGSDNANSLVLQISADDHNLLLPGDLEPPGTAFLIDTPRPPPGGVMMAPHHGSLRMDAQSVLQWARPTETVVSGGWRSKRPEVTEMLRSSGGGVHVTARDGAVRVRMMPQRSIEVRAWRKQPW